jgi:hypothetical protein
MLEPVAACLTPEVARRITEVRLDDEETMQRLEELREKANPDYSSIFGDES